MSDLSAATARRVARFLDAVNGLAAEVAEDGGTLELHSVVVGIDGFSFSVMSTADDGYAAWVDR